VDYALDFEWDEDKRQSNLVKHKIDFWAASNIFDGRFVVEAPSTFEFEERFLTTSVLDDGRCATVIWTTRGEKIRIISARRARDAEERNYRKLHHGRT
jgi:uncharacterized protein